MLRQPLRIWRITDNGLYRSGWYAPDTLQAIFIINPVQFHRSRFVFGSRRGNRTRSLPPFVAGSDPRRTLLPQAHAAGKVQRLETALIRAIIPNQSTNEPHIGAVTHHHDQSIAPVSFRIRNTMNSIPGNPIFILVSVRGYSARYALIVAFALQKGIRVRPLVNRYYFHCFVLLSF